MLSLQILQDTDGYVGYWAIRFPQRLANNSTQAMVLCNPLGFGTKRIIYFFAVGQLEQNNKTYG